MACNCFQLVADNKCSVLKVSKCTYPNCSFYCTYEHVITAKKRTAERLSTLEDTHQMEIAGKYYKNNMWWNRN